MLCVEDYIDALKWAEGLGGSGALIARTDANAAAIAQWVDGCDMIGFLANDEACRSTTSICLKFAGTRFADMDDDAMRAVQKRLVAMLEAEGVGFDLGAYRDSPPGLRLWAGATVDTSDLEALFPWVEQALNEILDEQ